MERFSERHHSIGRCLGVDLEAVCRYAIAGRRRRLYRDLILTGLAVVAIFPPLLAGPEESWVGTLRLLCAAAAFVTVFGERIVTRRIAAEHLTKGRYQPNGLQVTLGNADDQLLVEASAANAGNVVVYSGYSPFVGSGVELGNWSFAVDLTKPKSALGQSLQPGDVQVEELHRYIAERVAALRLDNVQVEDRLYVNGTEIREDRRFLPNPMQRPAIDVTAEVVREFTNAPTEAVRHYKCVTVTYWGGELVLSVFIRFVRVAKSLFAECSYRVLPPLKNEYHQIDSLTRTTPWTTYTRMATLAGFETLWAWPLAPLRVLNRALEGWWRFWRDAETERRIQQDNAFDFGCTSSLRELVQGNRYRYYFQVLDNSMYLKLLERQLLDGIVAFLDARNIDTGDIVERQRAILNTGVMVMGGVAAGGSVTLGQNIAAGLARIVRLPGGGSTPQPTKAQ